MYIDLILVVWLMIQNFNLDKKLTQTMIEKKVFILKV